MSIKKQQKITPEDMTDDKLLPCPCCGGRARIHKALYRYFDFVAVICIECGLKTADQPTIEAAVEKWNTRKPMDRIVEQLEEEIADSSQYGCEMEYRGGLYKAIEIVKEGGVNE